ncbi:UvrD-helicase domain-containing protein, partial [Ruegeria sp. HKCCD6604]|uniref:UvrD-helicase domain-containing protein n=1 Tax=Ruegeria sp. HKCCD6604 TaxID=2683000 RepID=UPI0020A1774E
PPFPKHNGGPVQLGRLKRLRRLVGDDSTLETVSTVHSLAMRLVGASFGGTQTVEAPDFKGLLQKAAALLRGDGLSKQEAEALRDTLIQGYRWILVDEYQDIGPDEYALIAAVAGRTLDDPDLRLSLFAVGDDDQNIYTFSGASIRYIRQFEQDYAAKPVFLTENYRSTGHIVATANAVIAGAAARMKLGHDITVNEDRRMTDPGGQLAKLDRVVQGRVQFLECPAGDDAQATAALEELIRISRLDPDWTLSRAAIISRDWRKLIPVRDFAENLGIPVEMANESMPSLWRMREMQAFVKALCETPTELYSLERLTEVLNTFPPSLWTNRIGEGLGLLAREVGSRSLPVPDIVEWFAEWARDSWDEQRGLKLLTAHRSKGLEFDDVVILDGGWERPSKTEDQDAPRRLFYVAMTRARRSLAVMSNDNHEYLPTETPSVLTRRVAPDMKALPSPRRFFKQLKRGWLIFPMLDACIQAILL